MTGLIWLWSCLFVLCGTVAARADGVWSGVWDTHWRDGGGQLILEQTGDDVTGRLPLYQGRLVAKAAGRELRGAWVGEGAPGQLLLVLGAGDSSFSGRNELGEWWTGARARSADQSEPVTLRSPRQALRTFLVSANLARAGLDDAWGRAADVVAFGAEDAKLSREAKLALVRSLFSLIDLTTFDLGDIADAAAETELMLRLPQSGSDATLALRMLRDARGDWRLQMPDAAALAAAGHDLLARNGGRKPSADAFMRLQNPRDTMRAFLQGMAAWDGQGRALALSTLDLRDLPEILRLTEGMLAAQYLRRVLDHIGMIGLQSIPDSGADRTPYVHFVHPAGRIEIAPSGPEADAPWLFTAATVADIDNVYPAVETMPPPLATPPGLIPQSLFFQLRAAVRATAPALLGRAGHVAYWQLIAAPLLIVLALFVGYAIARLLCWGIDKTQASGTRQPRLFFWSLTIVLAFSMAAPLPEVLGLPARPRMVSAPVIGAIISIAAAVVGWHLVRLLGAFFAALAERTGAPTDDILIALTQAAAKLAVVAAGALGVAYFLSIPANSIVAGLGIGGLAVAFASRETLSNIFGAGILVSDRPFRRGDWIKAGDIEGAIEHVGIRSTRVRTAQDSVMVVPNGKLADSTIDNLGQRRSRLVKTDLLVTAGATPERLEAFVQALRARLDGDASFVPGRTSVNVSDVTGQGIVVSLKAYQDIGVAGSEAQGRHTLMLDILRIAEESGLQLGPVAKG